MINVCYNCCSNEFNIDLINCFCICCVSGQNYCGNNICYFQLCYFVSVVCWCFDYCIEW